MVEPSERTSDADVLMMRRRCHVPIEFPCLVMPLEPMNFLKDARAVVALLGHPLVSKVIGCRKLPLEL